MLIAQSHKMAGDTLTKYLHFSCNSTYYVHIKISKIGIGIFTLLTKTISMNNTIGPICLQNICE
jgi:hypothetical protein